MNEHQSTVIEIGPNLKAVLVDAQAKIAILGRAQDAVYPATQAMNAISVQIAGLIHREFSMAMLDKGLITKDEMRKAFGYEPVGTTEKREKQNE